MWLMDVLIKIPMDGTFNQHRPLDLLKGAMNCFSYDLKSATDRWPLLVLFEIVQSLFDRSFASATVNSALACNVFTLPFVKKKHANLCFVAGQPLGYLSSWPLFSLAHHVVLWDSAEEVYPGRLFRDYAILGDDVVICDPLVAAEYARRLKLLQVEISYSKSLISRTGSAEFAKRFLVKGLSVDLSPYSVRMLLNISHPYGLFAIFNKYPNINFKSLMRIGGAGYRQMAKYPHYLNRKMTKLKLMCDKPSFDSCFFDYWIAGGRLLKPTHRGRAIALLREWLRPKDLIPAPVEMFYPGGYENVGELYIQEYTLLRGWMAQYLEYLHWYSKVALDDHVSLGTLLSGGPVVERRWKSSQRVEELVRFGYCWKLYDYFAKIALDPDYPVLGSGGPVRDVVLVKIFKYKVSFGVTEDCTPSVT